MGPVEQSLDSALEDVDETEISLPRPVHSPRTRPAASAAGPSQTLMMSKVALDEFKLLGDSQLLSSLAAGEIGLRKQPRIGRSPSPNASRASSRAATPRSRRALGLDGGVRSPSEASSPRRAQVRGRQQPARAHAAEPHGCAP